MVPRLFGNVDADGLAPGFEKPAIDRPRLPGTYRTAVEPRRREQAVGGAREQNLIGRREIGGGE